MFVKKTNTIYIYVYILYRDDIVPGRTGSGGKTRGHQLRSRLERVDPLSWFRYTMVIVSYIELNVTKKYIYEYQRRKEIVLRIIKSRWLFILKSF